MTLWAERQVKRDLGSVVHSGKPQSFDKLFQTPPHVEYIAREAKTASRLRRLMGTNVVELTNCMYMEKLEHMTVRAYREDVQERVDERARQARQLAHLQLWESVLRGQSKCPPEKLDDPCMRQVRQHQLKIEALHEKAVKLGTTVQRVAAMPHVWAEPSLYKPPERKKRSKTPPSASEASRLAPQHRSRMFVVSSVSPPRLLPSSTKLSRAQSRVLGRSESWRSRQLLMKISDEARAKRRYRMFTSSDTPSDACGYQYRRLTGESDAELGPATRHVTERLKKVVTLVEETVQPKDRRSTRITPPSKAPVVFPGQGPQLLLLSCDAEGGRSVMRPLGSTDFIIPRYFRPHAPNLLRAAKNLDDLYRLSKSMFDVPYPPVDNRDWKSVVSSRAEKVSKQIKQAQEVYPVRTFRLVK